MLTQTELRRAARLDETARATVIVSAPTMAGVRLRAALDAAMRDGLTAGDLMAFAGRIVSASRTEPDAVLLAALAPSGHTRLASSPSVPARLLPAG